ncbi:helix-turn-helix domain-containing protein [Sorangium sp. So ce117]|uniref:helix-turn-helix domain-containing protein n=1 Tax=Sorangium sp. So ce117 TaxID=3133277 RepID=UPI003F644C50
MNPFGTLLRDLRRKAGKTLEDVAQTLEVSIPYVSDVERGNRAPFSPGKIYAVASLLKVDPERLLVAAAESRGAFELDPKKSQLHREVGAALMRGWSELTDAELEKIRAIVGRHAVELK